MTQIVRCAAHRMKPRPWMPGVLQRVDQTLLVCVVYGTAWVRVLDYATGDNPHTRANHVAELLMPLWAWAVVLAVILVGLLVAWRARCHVGVWLCHFALGVMYLLLGGGLLISYIPQLVEFFLTAGDTVISRVFGVPERLPPTRPWELDGIRQAGPLLIIGVYNMLIAYRTGPDPLKPEDLQPTEVISEGGHG